MSRRPLLAGNWKMYKSNPEASQFFAELLKLISPLKNDRDVAFAVPFTCLETAAKAVAGQGISIAAQNLHWETEGAFTGEISASMIKSTGAGAVLIGHSERRQFFGDTGEWVKNKLRAALKETLIPIVCLGESLDERQGGRCFDLISKQLKEALTCFSADELAPLVLAYEPVWAIGTGLSASPEEAQEVHAFIRGWLLENFGKERAENCRILYGGSVKADNVAKLMAQKDIDGALVGGASLQADSFAKIINFDAQ